MNRRITAATIALLLTLTACGTSSVDGEFKESGGGAGSVSWENCVDVVDEATGTNNADDFTVECGDLTVPRDWNDPDGGTTTVALIRLRSKEQEDRIGSLLMNPGGPGASGIELASVTPLLVPEEIYKRFDIIGFDPRGVGESDPVRCADDEFKDETIAADPDPREEQAYQTAVSNAREFVRGCEKDKGDALATINTEQTARDMDAIRESVGDEKLNYLGYSYGTLLGSVYAQLFPDRIRAMVLDGAVDPSLDAVASSEGQAAGFERAFNNFAQNCQQRGTRCKVGPDARATVNRLLDEVRAQPLESDDGRTVTSGHVLYAVVSSLYNQASWGTLERGLVSLDEGDPDQILELADSYSGRDEDGEYDNSSDANTTVNCVDSAQSPVTPEQVRGLQEQWRAKYPLFGAPLAMTLLTCTDWPELARDPYPVGEAVGAPPIMVVGTTGDPATPYENTAKLAQGLGSGFVVTQQGEGHTSYPQASNCVRDVVNAYLLELEVPEGEVTCAPRR